MAKRSCMSGAINNVLFNGNHTNDNNTTTSSSSLPVDVLSNGNHKNDNNTTAPSSSLSVPWVRPVYRVYRYHQYCMPGATNYVLSDGNDTNNQCVVDFSLLLYH